MAVEAFLSDIHFPNHEVGTWNLTLRLLRRVNPDIIFLGGDIMDMHSVASYAKNPEQSLTIQDDIDAGVKELRRLRRAFPRAKIYYKEGNHETRLTRYMFSTAMALSPLRRMKLQSLLDLDEMDIEWIPNDMQYKIGELWHMHGNEVVVGGVYPARNMYLKVGVNVIFGHFHRESKYLDRSMDKKCHGAWGNSCMQTLDPEYLYHNQWTHGLHIIEYDRRGRFRVDPFTFFQEGGYECIMYNGHLLRERMAPPRAVKEHVFEESQAQGPRHQERRSQTRRAQGGTPGAIHLPGELPGRNMQDMQWPGPSRRSGGGFDFAPMG